MIDRSEGDSEAIGPLKLTASVWRVDSVDREPVVDLTQWRVYRLPDGSVHFIGWQELARQGRVTSAIEAFDPVRRCGRTTSGRVHRLIGNSGFNSDAGYTWNTWLRMYCLANCDDVTAAFEAMLDTRSQ